MGPVVFTHRNDDNPSPNVTICRHRQQTYMEQGLTGRHDKLEESSSHITNGPKGHRFGTPNREHWGMRVGRSALQSQFYSSREEHMLYCATTAYGVITIFLRFLK